MLYIYIYIYICSGKLTIVGSDNGLVPGRRQAIIIWTSAGISLIGPLGIGTNLSEIFMGIQTFSFKKIHLKMASAKYIHPFCLSLNVLINSSEIAFCTLSQGPDRGFQSHGPTNSSGWQIVWDGYAANCMVFSLQVQSVICIGCPVLFCVVWLFKCPLGDMVVILKV